MFDSAVRWLNSEQRSVLMFGNTGATDTLTQRLAQSMAQGIVDGQQKAMGTDTDTDTDTDTEAEAHRDEVKRDEANREAHGG